MSPDSHFIDKIRHQTHQHNDRRAFTFLDDHLAEVQTLTFGELERKACAIAAHLQQHRLKNQRALLLYPPGLDFIAAYLGCLYAGVVAVPCHVPKSGGRQWYRLEAILNDSRPLAILTVKSFEPKVASWLEQGPTQEPSTPVFCLATDTIPNSHADTWRRPDLATDALAMLQYTSGSTGVPKGVMVTHGNLFQNETEIARAFGQDSSSIVVGWLPLYHDMGLIGNVLQPLFTGFPAILMSPMTMLQNPVTWLEAISRYQATTSGGPNFAYDLCARRIGEPQKEHLDLSCWQVAFNGSEPIRPGTLDRFSAAFQGCGFQKKVFFPCYGLAEFTLFVAGAVRELDPPVQAFNKEALEKGVIESNMGDATYRLVSSGHTQEETLLCIVHPESGMENDGVGEVWLAGKSASQGYWGHDALTQEVFHATLPSQPGKTFLRTGDLGFLHKGMLFITGRLKELMIIRGRNFYPQDIERIAQDSHEALAEGCGAAFSIEYEGEERPVLVQEVKRSWLRKLKPNIAEEAIRQAVAETLQLNLFDVVLIKRATLAKTTSGKVRRLHTRAAYLKQELVRLEHTNSQSASSKTAEQLPKWLEKLTSASDPQKLVLIIDYLRGALSDLSGLDLFRLDTNKSLFSVGLDSIMAMDLVHRLERDFNLTLPLNHLLNGPSLMGLATSLLALFNDRRHRTRISKIPRDQNLVLSYSQHREWLLDQMETTSGVYNIQIPIELHGSLDRHALAWSFSQIAQRHEALRTQFHEGYEPHQVVIEQVPAELVWVDFSGLKGDAQKIQVAAFVAKDRFEPFQLDQAPLYRLFLLKLSDTEHLLLMNFHHIIFDGWSMNVLMAELDTLYHAKSLGRPAPNLPSLPIQYPDYAHWQRQQVQSEAGMDSLNFWRTQLAHAPDVLNLFITQTRKANAAPALGSRTLTIPADLTQNLKTMCKRHSCTLFSLLIASYQVLLARYSQLRDISVGSFVANRHADVENLIGFFVNTLVFRTRLKDDQPFEDILAQVQQTVRAALAHQDLPFEKVLEELNPHRNEAHTPLFQHMLVLQHFPAKHWTLRNLTLSVEPFQGFGRAHFDTTVWLWDEGDQLSGILEYDSHLFDGASMDRFCQHFLNLLQAVSSQPQARWSHIALMSGAARQRLLYDWNARPKDVIGDETVHRWFEKVALKTPNAIALTYTDTEVTYAELLKQARSLARLLVERGIQPDHLVAILLENPVKKVIAMLGVLGAGAAFLPLDLNYPAARRAFMLENSNTRVLISSPAIAEDLMNTVEQLISFDQLDTHTLDGSFVSVLPQHTAYAIYTSGSTGKPKGTLIPHGEFAAMLAWGVAYFGLDGHSRVLHGLSYSFDFGLFECFTTLLCGGRLVFQEPDQFGDPIQFAKDICRHGITTVHATPSFIREVMNVGLEANKLEIVHLGGEAVTGDLIGLIAEHTSPNCAIYNGYGPTEASINSTIYRIDREADAYRSAIPIGRNSANHHVYILDSAGNPTAAGLPGELVISGGLARGYLGLPALTAERFLPDAYSQEPGQRLYPSGDLVYLNSEEEIVFLDRMDDQVKIRGYRIECREIEREIMRDEAIADAVVVSRKSPRGDHRLIAFAVLRPEFMAHEDSQTAIVQAIQKRLAASLPEYMVPLIQPLASLPKTPSGKTDRNSLPEISLDQVEIGTTYVQPRNATESILAGILGDCLGVEKVGIHDSFFELGGHSLIATRAIYRIRKAFGKELPLRAFFEKPNVAQLAQVIAEGSLESIPPVHVQPRGQDFPLSFSQERIWFLNQLNPEMTSYHVPRCLRISGPFNTKALSQAYVALIERHEILRTSFPTLNHRPVQRIHPPGDFPIPILDLRRMNVKAQEHMRQQVVKSVGSQLFDLENGPLMRAVLLIMSPTDHVLIHCEHHLVHDGWTERVLVGDLLELFRAFTLGERPRLKPLPIQFVDFACWQREWLQGDVLKRQLVYWKTKLANPPSLLQLPTDFPRPPVLSTQGSARILHIDNELTAALKAFSNQHDVSLYMVMMAAFKTLLFRYSGQEDLVVGTGVANRRLEETEGMIGMVINTLALRSDLSGNPTFQQLLHQVRDTCLEAFAHEDVPYEKVVEAIQPERSLSFAPLFQVIFAFYEVASLDSGIPGQTLELIDAHNQSAKFDILCIVAPPEGEGEITVQLEWSTDLFLDSTMLRFWDQYMVLLRAIIDAVATPISQLAICPAEERQTLISNWSARTHPVETASVPDRLREWAVSRPHKIAVESSSDSLSYAVLDRRASVVATSLLTRGVGPESMVGVCMAPSLAMIVAMLGVWKAGATYLPLDPKTPQRSRTMVREAHVALVILEESDAPSLDVAQIILQNNGELSGVHSFESLDSTNLKNPLPDNLAYGIFTSGSTGTPKCVGISHRNLNHLISWHLRNFGVAEKDRASQVANPLFDACVWEIWPYLYAGATVVIPPRDLLHDPGLLRNWIADQALTIAFLPTPLAEIFLALEEVSTNSLRYLLTGGDRLRSYPPQNLPFTTVNNYGPTEATVVATSMPLDPDQATHRLPPIGKPIDNTRIYIADQELQPTPIGVYGELLIGGPSLARGYLGQPSLTALKFVPDGISGEKGARLYCSGDRGRFSSHGVIEFLERMDHQVKLRGYRIELGEIESKLKQHPTVEHAVVLLHEPQPGQPFLAAYLTCSSNQPPTQGQLEGYLAELLPPWMIPSAMVLLERMPLTANGKIDREALPQPQLKKPVTGDYVAPSTKLQKRLAHMWQELLGLNQVGIHDNFFELGGHSLIATQIQSRIRSEFQVETPIKTFFKAPTIDGLSQWISAASQHGQIPEPKPAPRQGNLPLSLAQQRLWFLTRWSEAHAAYNVPIVLRLQGKLDKDALVFALEQMIDRHEILRTVIHDQDGTPYQVILEPDALELEILSPVTWGTAESVSLHSELDQLLLAESRKPIDLGSWPLFRIKLYELGHEDHVLQITLHHMICDGWSLGVIIGELSTFYKQTLGHTALLPTPLTLQFADYASWQRDAMEAELFQEQLTYWQNQLQDLPPELDLGIGRPARQQDFEGEAIEFQIPDALMARVRQWGRPQEISDFMVLLSVFYTLLHRYSGLEDLPVGTPVAGRNRSEFEPLIGFFANTLVLRGDLRGQPRFSEVVQRVKTTALAAFDHQDVPFEKLVEILQPERMSNRSPLFQVVFTLQPAAPTSLKLPDLEIKPIALDNRTAKFDLTVLLTESEEGLHGKISYRSDRFQKATIQRLAGHYLTLLEAAIEAPETPIHHLTMLPPEECAWIRDRWRVAQPEARDARLLHKQFEAIAAKQPHAAALLLAGTEADQDALDYHSLNRQANQFAHYLRDLGLGPESMVGLCLEPTPDLVIAILAILKAGACYIPMDVTHPPDWRRRIAEDAGIELILTTDKIPFIEQDSSKLLFLDSQTPLWSDAPESNLDVPVDADNAAYIIYTSGTTGNPKGVVITHAHVDRLMRSADALFDFDANDVWSLFHSSAFDFSVWELWGALLHGAQLVIVPHHITRDPVAFQKIVLDKGISVLSQTPSAFYQLAHAFGATDSAEAPSLRYVVFGGEALDFERLSTWIDQFGDQQPQLINMYGITETTVHVTFRRVLRKDVTRSGGTLGGPLPHLSLYLASPELELVPLEVPGELLVGGAGPARGYLNRPALTALGFVPDPFGDQVGARLYRSGDLARVLANGDPEYLGRLDHQVKIRGFRIELGEIEAAIHAFPGVSRCLVLLRPDHHQEESLVGFLVAQPGLELDLVALREHLKTSLPVYMVPSALVPLDSLPLTHNTKVDRKALIAMPLSHHGHSQATHFEPTVTSTERALKSIWSELLGVEQLDRSANFFDLGGHSLLATKLLARIQMQFHVTLPIQAFFEAPQLSAVAEWIDIHQVASPAPSRIQTVPRDKALPLSYAQQRLWFLDQLEDAGSFYNIPIALHLRGKPDVQILVQCFQQIIARHESLRTGFSLNAGVATQQIKPLVPFTLHLSDLSLIPAEEREPNLQHLLREEARQSFDLEVPPLLRARLILVEADAWVLAITMHHIISDGWSLEVFFKEFAALYQANLRRESPPLAPLPIQYADFASWQRDQLQSNSLTREIAYWRQRLADLAPLLTLPTDFPRPAVQTNSGDSVRANLSPSLCTALTALGKRENATLFMTLLAAFKVLLARYANVVDVAVGTPVSGRNQFELEPLIGFFVNPLVLRSDLTGNPDFLTLLNRVRNTTLEAFAHQDLPFEMLVEALQPERSLSHAPLFQVLFTLQNFSGTEQRLPDFDMTILPQESLASKYDLSLYAREQEDGIHLHLEFNTSLFQRQTIVGMLHHFEVLLTSIAHEPQQAINRIPLMDTEDHQKLLFDWNPPAATLLNQRPLHELFAAQVKLTPDAVALVWENQSLSFKTLDQSANRLANLLINRGVTRETPVAVCLTRSPAMIVSLLAIMKAGGAYVPLDPNYPRERIALILEDAGVPIVIAQKETRSLIERDSVSCMCLDRDQQEMRRNSSNAPASSSSLAHLAYIIYTSGSTGKPKGVAISHSNALAMLDWATSVYTSEDLAGTLASTSICFDISVFEIFLPLIRGGRIFLVDNVLALMDTRFQHEITLINTVPSAMDALVRNMALPESLRVVNLAGEPLSLALVQRVYETAGVQRVFNLYGPSEDTTFSTAALVDKKDTSRPSIGRPIHHTQAYLLDSTLSPVPIGVTGELYLGGAGVSRGYFANPGLTAERYIPDPFRAGGQRLFRTGDMARYLAYGEIDFLGRQDSQIKLRGFRIELGEIETVLQRHPAVAEAAVLLTSQKQREDQLIAYVVLEPGTQQNTTDLRATLAEHLPQFMAPSAYVFLAALPLNANGKIDRQALRRIKPDVENTEQRKREIEPTNDPVKAIVTEIWAEALGVTQVDAHENFFDLGGHSLLIPKIYSDLQARLQIQVSLVDLFKYPTIEQLSRFLNQRLENQDESTVVPHITRRSLPQASGDVAVIGMAGKFPGAEDVETLWKNIAGSTESITFFEQTGHPPELPWVGARGVLDDADTFDAHFFNMPPREAEILDPQQRLLLECAHAALENAAVDPERFGGRIGVFAGVSISTYLLRNLLPNWERLSALGAYPLFLANSNDFVSTRISYLLGLTGPSINVNTACSTSLVGVHLACQSLLKGESDIALAGGASIALPQDQGYPYQQQGILSPDGHCRAFDAKAQGTVPGNGAGIVVLKPLEAAMADGDVIHAVIKGSAINNDGSRKVSFTAPSVQGQAEVIQAALASAGITPETIGYIETHGTGTKLGDPIELAALRQVFGTSSDQGHGCALGSVKTNVGHLDAAAGITGLIKTVMALKHKQLPPSLHFQQANAELRLEGSPFFVNTQLQEWPGEHESRRAGVSSFGIGGTNAHIVLESYEAKETAYPAMAHVLPISAKTEQALHALVEKLALHCGRYPDLDLARIAASLQLGRTAHPWRLIALAEDTADAAALLADRTSDRVFFQHAEEPPRIVFLFPGQGCQHLHMALPLFRSEPVFKASLDRCAAILEKRLGLDIRELMFAGKADDDAAQRLQNTRFAQPTIFAVSYAMAQLWGARGVSPAAMLGHSLGEYVAACVGGVFSLEDALALIALRGQLMAEQPAGTMAALACSAEQLQLPQGIALAAINGPKRCVISGNSQAVAAYLKQLENQGIDASQLHTSHAFHSEMMLPVVEPLRKALAGMQLHPPSIPIVSNVTGQWLTDVQALDPDYWARHLMETVQFNRGLGTLSKMPNILMLEVGPGQSLVQLVRPQWTHARQRILATAPNHRNPMRGRHHYLETLGKLWLNGLAINWQDPAKQGSVLRTPLPTYPFERRRYWIDADSRAFGNLKIGTVRQSIDNWFYQPQWRSGDALLKVAEPQVNPQETWVIFSDGSPLAEAFRDRLAMLEVTVWTVAESSSFEWDETSRLCQLATPEDWFNLASHFRAEGIVPHRVVLFTHGIRGDFSLNGLETWRAYHHLLSLVRAFTENHAVTPLHLGVITTRLQTVLGSESSDPSGAILLGPCRVIPQEYPHIRCQNIDLETFPGPREHALHLANHLLSDLVRPQSEPFLAYRGQKRWRQTYEPLNLPLKDETPTILRDGGVYLITGGLGRIGLELAQALADRTQARLALITRKPLPPEQVWDSWLERHDAQNPMSRKIMSLRKLREQSEVLVIVADVADPHQVRQAVEQIEKQWGSLHGVLHLAGGSGSELFQPIEQSDSQAIQALFQAKVTGAKNLQEALSDKTLDFQVVFSSLASVLGGIGFAGYSAANLFLDRWIERQAQNTCQPGLVSLNWDGWSFTQNSTATTPASHRFAMTPQEGIKAFFAILHALEDLPPNLVISTGDLHQRLAQWVFDPGKRAHETRIEQHQRPTLKSDFVAPRDDDETALAETWQHLLGIQNIGIHDNFFELGGDSLMATRLFSQIRAEHTVKLPYEAFYNNPTIADLAESWKTLRWLTNSATSEPHQTEEELTTFEREGGRL